jgi:ankyrin repeat protein
LFLKGKKKYMHNEQEFCFDINTHKMLNGGVNPAVFHQLVKDRNLQIIRSMIKNKADLNQKGVYGYTPLMIASLTGNLEGVKLLIGAGAEVDVAQKDGQTALWLAAFNGGSEIVSYLAKEGADLNKFDNQKKQTPLMIASDFGYLDTVRALIKAGADVNFVSPYGQTALSYALIGRSRNIDIVKKLVHSGADIHSCPKSDNERVHTLPPLVLSVLHRNPQGVKFLLSKGADGLDMALRFAELKLDVEMQKLLKKGVKISSSRNNICTQKARERE